VTAGYSGTPLPSKLGIKPDARFGVRHAPDSFDATLGDLPEGAMWLDQIAPGLDVVLGFYTERSELLHDWPQLTAAVAPNGTVWVCWPKKSSRRQTDITEDVLRDVLLPTGWVDNKVCAVDDTWSGLRFALRRELR
jgi:hypothetical protein